MDEFNEILTSTTEGWEDEISNKINVILKNYDYELENTVIYTKWTFNKDENKFWVLVDIYERVWI